MRLQIDIGGHAVLNDNDRAPIIRGCTTISIVAVVVAGDSRSIDRNGFAGGFRSGFASNDMWPTPTAGRVGAELETTSDWTG